ncbi:helix-turn-helix domain-containing protein [Streptomyces sp. NPDC088812]|uniref:helix-turn-helix domain-containing protein n=1 Tax=Streptomyces sp. NPDC088812 TaxID=3365905 RepID=UPI0037F71808
MNEISCDFGSELRRRRSARGFSLISFSKKISCSKSHLSKVERGLAMASRDFAKVCDDAGSSNLVGVRLSPAPAGGCAA